MNKTQIIKKIVGEKLKGYGFQYLKTDGPLRIFIREAHGYKRYYDPELDVVKQYVIIQDYSSGGMMTVHFKTDVTSCISGDELNILRELNPNKGDPWFEYANEEEYKEVLMELCKIIIEYGLEFLNQMSVEEEYIHTKAMAEELYKDHKELDKRFIKKYEFIATPRNFTDIETWFLELREMIIAASEKPYEEVKELFLEMAAFIGERHCELLGAKWFYEEEYKTPYTQRERNAGRGLPTLRYVVGYYRGCKKKEKIYHWFMNEILEFKEGLEEIQSEMSL